MSIKADKEEVVMAVSNIAGDPRVIDGLIAAYDKLVDMGINTGERWALFLGNCAHETAMFTRLEENLNYSEQRLLQVWPTRFTRASARQCANNPKALANFVYNGRLGNRPGTDDGWNFRGSGAIQTTGSENFMRAQNALGLPVWADPDLLRSDWRVGFLAAGLYFSTTKYKGRSLLSWADDVDHKAVCRAINSGEHGLVDRVANTTAVMQIMNVNEGVTLLPLLKVNQRTSGVKMLRQLLRIAGYTVYNVTDTFFDAKLYAAVMAFQEAEKLSMDGVVGTGTWMRLRTRAAGAMIGK